MSEQEKEYIIYKVSQTNTRKYNLLKASEEFQELALILTQQRTKKNKDFEEDIIEEIGDCKIRLMILEHLFDKDKIEERVQFKLSKFQEYLDKGKYKNHI